MGIDSELVMGEKFGPQLQAADVVHGEQVHGGSTGGRNPHDAHTAKQKVLRPPVASGVEEGHKLAAQAIHPREISALVKITAVAGQREILDLITPRRAVWRRYARYDASTRCAPGAASSTRKGYPLGAGQVPAWWHPSLALIQFQVSPGLDL